MKCYASPLDVCHNITKCEPSGKCFYEKELLTMEPRHGSPEFYKLTAQMNETHNKKSHDYAPNNDPFANYKFAGMMSKLFTNPDDAGFIGRIGEKLYRLSNLENNAKEALNESIEDTEIDIVTITALWIAMRRERRQRINKILVCDDCRHQALHHTNKGCKFCTCLITEEELYGK